MTNKTPWSSDFIDIEGEKEPKYKTRVKMLWDEKFLYFFAELQEPHIWATLKQRDTIIFYNNDFEIFIDPTGDTHNYLELEVNALNTVWDLFLTKPYRNHGKAIDQWDINGLETAVSIEGTLNDNSDIDTKWNVEIAIPWDVLLKAGDSNKIPKNSYWRINFSRVNWDFDFIDKTYSHKKDKNNNFLPEYNWVWSPQYVINMHEPEHWGYVYFSENDPKNTTTFTIPDEEMIKQYLYQQYRKLHTATTNFKLLKKEIVSKKLKILGHDISLHLETHQSGWNLWTKSPFSDTILMIKEDGLFKKYKSTP